MRYPTHALFFDGVPVLFGTDEDFVEQRRLADEAARLKGNAPERYAISPWGGPYPLAGQLLEVSLVKLSEAGLNEAARVLGWEVAEEPSVSA